ncbi:MAG: type I restriction endonuclease subunit R [Tateyamaria sp.]|uniref:type I restriction endonuclease subunit R n=1 Tax=Tateyamaria sp. TaxID=1929288 RepID=UPI00329BF957
MVGIGELERKTQNRVIQMFKDHLDYDILGDWHERDGNSHVEKGLLTDWLSAQGHSATVIARVLREVEIACTVGGGKTLYDANKAFYSLLRYGVKVKDEGQDQNQTVWLINWAEVDKNSFAIAEEVSIKGENTKRPDVVIYVNGLALAVIELKRSSVSVGEGIRQNITNQDGQFIRDFFTTMQFCFAGNDTEGLRYGTIGTPERHYYQWKEDVANTFDSPLDYGLSLMCRKERLLALIHDFIVFDKGIKKLARHNQFRGVTKSHDYVRDRRNGIIWHTQGSGKSLTMVWLAKWIRENVEGARVLVITDRTELDDQIEKVFKGVDEQIYRTKSGDDLISALNSKEEWLIGSLVHKFGHQGDANEEKAMEAYLSDLKKALPSDFEAKGEIFVFVDECHRTQSGKLHEAMKAILPDATFIGFTGTPLLRTDKRTTMEVFGTFIDEYRFDEAIEDEVVLDLHYDPRDIDQSLSSKEKVDEWFEANTKGLTASAKSQLMLKWGTMQRLLSSQNRLDKIVQDITMDMMIKPRLLDGRGNAMLVCSSIYEACKVYELAQQSVALRGHCAVISSYAPQASDMANQSSGQGVNETIFKYNTYRKMLAEFFEESEDDAMGKVEEFEAKVKQRFLDEPAQMRLLIVVDKLLTGFDAPSATYLYIDKKMENHGLFQAICRVNRLDGEDKDKGHIVDYKDLFNSLGSAIVDYTSEAFSGYEEKDITGLLADRLERGKERLDDAREAIKALCEPVDQPKEFENYKDYFIGDALDKEAVALNENKRIALYKCTAALTRAFANLANEMASAGYSSQEEALIKSEVYEFSHLSSQIKLASGDFVDMKQFEPAMRQLLDMYVRAEDSEKLTDFEDMGLIELVVKSDIETLLDPKETPFETEEAMAEAIATNVSRRIIDERQVNPAYYDKMSDVLVSLVEERRQGAIDYKSFLEAVKQLAEQFAGTGASGLGEYPDSVDTPGKRALFDNFGEDENWVLKVVRAVVDAKTAGWVSSPMPQPKRAVMKAIYVAVGDLYDPKDVLDIVMAQNEFQ